MSSAPVSPEGHVDEIVAAVESETGATAIDRYPCLIRVGEDWHDYPFEWKPFQALAESIEWPDDAPPIVVMSSGEDRASPSVGTHSDPHPHLRIEVSPAVPVAAIVDTWIAQIAGYAPRRSKPDRSFLKHLELKPDDVSAEVRRFLGLEEIPEAQPIALSPTVERIAASFGTSEVSAFAIADALRKRHGEYASYRLGRSTLSIPEDAASHDWERWRDSVAGLYNRSAIAKSQHKVLDGRLLLVGLGLYDKALREALQAADVWAPLLLEIDETLVEPSGPLRNALNAVQLAHGYESDSTGGKDQLGIEGEVNALCEVIMDPKVAPPLAVGLFGAWGSGKSFFMEKMRERVHQLTAAAAENRPKNVVQIRFNAWHYSDSSLWASLAVEIFERLADPEPIGETAREDWLKGRGDPRRKEREQLLSNLETYREAKAALDKERRHLVKERRCLKREKKKAEADRKSTLAHFQLTDVAAELARDPDVKAGLQRIANDLSMKPAVDQLTSIAAGLQTTSGYLAAIWRTNEHPHWTAGLIVAAVVFLVLAAAANPVGGVSWLYSLVPALASMASAVAAASKYLIPAGKTVSRALAEVSSAIDKATQVKARLVQKRTREERELDTALAEHREGIAEVTRSIAALNERITAISAQAEALSVGRRLYDFLADRAAGYQKHQGVVGMLHRDFRLLDAQLRAQASDADQSGLPRIDRVVLYVDDLDRCSPEKVLEVLEAVHLLLALELFIVVVGVDPRWLQRSLQHQYRDLCLSADLTQDPYLQAMPTEYLEKIFQIPLTLPAMENKAYGRLVSSLAPGTAVPTPSTAPGVSTGPTRRAKLPESSGGARAPTRALLEVQEGSAAQGPGGASIDLTSEEVLFAQQLGGLIATPRAAKRLMNTYRLIRATQHVGSRSRFLGADGRPGEYFAVLTLLAIAAGYPRHADRVLVALEEDAAKEEITDWKAFLDGLDPLAGRLVPDDIKTAGQQDRLSQVAAAECENMLQGLQASLPNNRLKDLEPYQRWGRTVARFSFTL